MSGERADGAPSEWFVRSKDEALQPEISWDSASWLPAAGEAPDAVERWRRLFSSAVVDFGGVAPTAPGQPRFDLAQDRSPRELRLWLDDDHWHVVLLRPDADVDLWVEGVALQEVQRQRSGGASRSEADGVELVADEEDEGFLDPFDFQYEQLKARAQDLAVAALDRYADLFLRFGRFPTNRRDDARDSLELTVTTNAEPPIIQATSHFTGETTWLYDWDGSTEAVIEFVEDLAVQHGDWVHFERSRRGPTEWDAEPC